MSTSQTKAIAEMYSSRSDAYDTGNDSLHVRQCEAYICYLKPYLRPGVSVLDLACGTGILTLLERSLVGAEGRVVGVDVARGMLDIARQKSHDQGLGVEWYEHDVSDLSALDLGSIGGFDLVTCASALVLLPSPTAAVRGWTQLLKPGARVMADVHMPAANIVMDIFATIGPEVGQTLNWDLNAFRTQDSLAKVFEDAELEVEKAWESESFLSREYDVENAEGIFENALKNHMFSDFGKEGVKEKARVEFIRRLKEIGGSGKRIKEETTYWMIIGKKTV